MATRIPDISIVLAEADIRGNDELAFEGFDPTDATDDPAGSTVDVRLDILQFYVGTVRLKAWGPGALAYATAITFDSDGVASSATLVWPDGSGGTWTRTAVDTNHNKWTGATASHTYSGLTATITRTLETNDAEPEVGATKGITVSVA